MGWPGDWICISCQHLNFSWRESCRQCQESRPLGISTGCWVHNFQPGDWFCSVWICQAHNFAMCRACFKCGTAKSTPSFDGKEESPMAYGVYGRRDGIISRPWWKPGDWFCGRPGCSAHNYATRVKCFRCNSSKELVGNAQN